MFVCYLLRSLSVIIYSEVSFPDDVNLFRHAVLWEDCLSSFECCDGKLGEHFSDEGEGDIREDGHVTEEINVELSLSVLSTPLDLRELLLTYHGEVSCFKADEGR